MKPAIGVCTTIIMDLSSYTSFLLVCNQVYSNSRASISSSKIGRLDSEDGFGRPQKLARHQDVDQYSGAEYDFD